MALRASSLNWLSTTISIAFFIILVGAVSWGTVLEIRFIGPYTLRAASRQQKWQRAALIMFLQTVPFALLGLLSPIIGPGSSNPWYTTPLCCGAAWLIVYPLAILFKYWEFQRHLKRYRRLNERIRSGAQNKVASFLAFKPISWALTPELKRFFVEGYPEDTITERNGRSDAPE